MAVNTTIGGTTSLEPSGRSQLYLITALVVGVVFLASRFWRPNLSDLREPSLIRPKIPFLGHVIGMLMHQSEYLSTLSSKLQLPIFMIKIFGSPLYIINSPELTQSVFRHSKAFSFDPITTSGAKRLFQMTERQMKLLASPVPGITDVEFPLNALVVRAMHNIMTPGPNSQILVMNARALNRFSDFVNPIDKDGIVVEMFAWLNETFMVATSVGIYGPDSPLENDRTLVKHLNQFEDSIGLIMINVAPSIIASKGHQGREAYKAAFQKYYREGGHKKTSGLATARLETLSGGGFNTDDVGSFDIGIMLAASMNSNPAIFWLISYIFSDPELLAEIRIEAASVVSTKNGEATIDISQLLKASPLLTSCMQEMLRVVDATVSIRTVMEDSLLNDTYLLRKGGIIQLVCAPMHTSPSIWGDDSHLFNARRFLKATQDKLSKESRKNQKNGYTPFGGGASLCPGRHFATMEILAVAATIVLGYEITMADGSVLKMAKPKKQAFAVQVKHVEGDLKVRIKRREGWEDLKWVYDVGVGEAAGTEDMGFDNSV